MNDLVDRLAVAAATTQTGPPRRGRPDRPGAARPSRPALVSLPRVGRRHRRDLHRRRHRHRAGGQAGLDARTTRPSRSPPACAGWAGPGCWPTAPRWRPTPCWSEGAGGWRSSPPRASATSSRSPARPGRRSMTRGPTGRSRWCPATSASRWPAGWMPPGKEVAPLGPAARHPGRRRRGGRLPPARRPQPAPRAGGRRRPSAGRGGGLLQRGLARVPGVRADGDHRRRRLPAPARARPTWPPFEPLAGEVLVMTSAGGLDPPGRGGRPARSPCSSRARPAACWRPRRRPAAAGFADCVTFDMGGTSTDVCLIRGGRPEPAAERRVAGLPIRMPALDVHTIGAGGGSLAAIDAGGALVVGPAERRGRPGPGLLRAGRAAAHGDRRRPGGRAASRRRGWPAWAGWTPAAARRALDAGGVTAAGVIAVVDHAMVQAVRVVSVQRGVDPAGLALVAFGGAGPLHACALADALGMPAVVVPPRAGVLSAVGMLAAPRQVDLVRSWPDPGRPRRRRSGCRSRSERAAAARRRRPGRGRPRLPLRRPEPRAHGGPRRRLRGRARPAQRVPAWRTPRSRWWPSGPRPAGRRPSTWPPSPARPRRAGSPVRPSSPSRTAPSGWRRAGGRTPIRRARGSSPEPLTNRELVDHGSGGPAGSDLAADGRGHRDGRGAATVGPFPEYQGAGRLLGRRVHGRRRAAGPGRAHSGPSGQHAGVGGGRHRGRARPRGRATRWCSTTRSPAAPTSTT